MNVSPQPGVCKDELEYGVHGISELCTCQPPAFTEAVVTVGWNPLQTRWTCARQVSH